MFLVVQLSLVADALSFRGEERCGGSILASRTESARCDPRDQVGVSLSSS